MSLKEKMVPGPWQLTSLPMEMLNTDSAATIYGPPSVNGGACLIMEISRSPGDQKARVHGQLALNIPEMVDLLQRLDTWYRSVGRNEHISVIANDTARLLIKINDSI